MMMGDEKRVVDLFGLFSRITSCVLSFGAESFNLGIPVGGKLMVFVFGSAPFSGGSVRVVYDGEPDSLVRKDGKYVLLYGGVLGDDVVREIADNVRRLGLCSSEFGEIVGLLKDVLGLLSLLGDVVDRGVRRGYEFPFPLDIGPCRFIMTYVTPEEFQVEVDCEAGDAAVTGASGYFGGGVSVFLGSADDRISLSDVGFLEVINETGSMSKDDYPRAVRLLREVVSLLDRFIKDYAKNVALFALFP